MNIHISNANNQVHELAPPTCELLLSKNIDPPQYCSSWSMFMIALSSPPLSSKDNSYLCSFLSPFVINDHKKGRSHMKFSMWRSMATTWSCTSCTCRITTWIPLVGNHMKHLWFDTKSWTWVDGWVLNLHFWWTLSIWLEFTPLVTTTCGSMKTTLKCHM